MTSLGAEVLVSPDRFWTLILRIPHSAFSSIVLENPLFWSAGKRTYKLEKLISARPRVRNFTSLKLVEIILPGGGGGVYAYSLLKIRIHSARAKVRIRLRGIYSKLHHY